MIKDTIKDMIQNNSIMYSTVLKAKNDLHTGSDTLCVSSIHFVNNRISEKGTNNSISFEVDDYIRNSTISIEGNNNSIRFEKGLIPNGSITIRIIGDNNVIVFKEETAVSDVNILILGNGNMVYVGRKCSLTFVQIIMERDMNNLSINDESTFHGRGAKTVEFHLDEQTSISIGKDCMISNDVQFRSSDNHSVLDDNSKRLNQASNIVIGDHVWIGMRTLVMKGSVIHTDSVIAASSLCNKDYIESNVLIAGMPAVIKKKNINWSRDRL